MDQPLKIEKIDEPPIPNNYVFRRGREDKALDFAEESIEPPPGYFKLNLYSGDQLKGFTNMNPTQLSNEDKVHSPLDYPWPFEDNSVLAINIGSNICQILDLESFVCECWRVLVSGGIFHIKAPYYTSMQYVANLRNIIPICDNTFSYFVRPWCKKEGIVYEPQCDFDIVQRLFFYDEDWLLVGDQAREYAKKHYNNVITVMEIKLAAIKPIRKL